MLKLVQTSLFKEVYPIKIKRLPICLRCGECCIRFDIEGIPNYHQDVKPAGVECCYLIPPIYNPITEQVTPAICRLHQTGKKPRACCDWPPSNKSAFCQRGLDFWQNVLQCGGIIDYRDDFDPESPEAEMDNGLIFKRLRVPEKIMVIINPSP